MSQVRKAFLVPCFCWSVTDRFRALDSVLLLPFVTPLWGVVHFPTSASVTFVRAGVRVGVRAWGWGRVGWGWLGWVGLGWVGLRWVGLGFGLGWVGWVGGCMRSCVRVCRHVVQHSSPKA